MAALVLKFWFPVNPTEARNFSCLIQDMSFINTSLCKFQPRPNDQLLAHRLSEPYKEEALSRMVASAKYLLS